MKPLLLMLGLLTTCSVFADSFTTVKDGKNYICTESAPPSPNGAADCVNEAYHGPFSQAESIRLCTGARNTDPAKCGITAYHGPFSTEQSIQLCQGTRTASGPADCAIAAYHGPFSTEESIELCARNGDMQTYQCAKTAYAGPYSTAEAVQLCKSANPLILRSLKLIEQSPEVQQRLRLMKR